MPSDHGTRQRYPALIVKKSVKELVFDASKNDTKIFAIEIYNGASFKTDAVASNLPANFFEMMTTNRNQSKLFVNNIAHAQMIWSCGIAITR